MTEHDKTAHTESHHKGAEHAHKNTHKTHSHVHKKRKKKCNYTKYIIGGIVLVLIVVILSQSMSRHIEVTDADQYGSVPVTFYVMSQCPYGTQVEDAIEPVMKEIGTNIDFRLEFIAGEVDGGFQSLHGQPEVDGDIIQLCVQEQYPERLIEFVVCQNKDVRDLVGSIDKCAKQIGADADKIRSCFEGAQGKKLMSESISKSMEVNAQGSPTIYIDGKLYQGQRDETSFKRTICQGLGEHPVCANMPACANDVECAGEPGKVGVCNNPGKADATCTYKDDAEVKLTVVSSKECLNCDASQLVAVLSQVFLNMEVEEVDASNVEGAALVKSLNLEKAPAYVFTGDVSETYSWQNNPNIPNAFRKVGEKFIILDDASGATYILDKKKRDEIEKLTGVTKGDNRPQIDFYVMSYCPYGNMAEEAIEPAYQLLKGKADFNPHYVIYSNYQGGGPNFCLDKESKYCSMHGVQELNQGLRELCVDKYIGIDAYFKFVLEMNKKCSASNADSCWEPVAKGLGLDVAKIKGCEADEWETILAGELALNKALGVSGSPTVFVEGAAYSGSRAAAGFAQALCQGFTTAPDACNPAKLAALAGDEPAPASDAGGCG
ncbi:MAG: hypothetical protein V1729_07165 [Candidatus Woesearchaeota archaeon]